VRVSNLGQVIDYSDILRCFSQFARENLGDERNVSVHSMKANMATRRVSPLIFNVGITWSWDRGSTMVKVLRYKSEGRWFGPRRFQGIFH
jgi:hypothetical protein